MNEDTVGTHSRETEHPPSKHRTNVYIYRDKHIRTNSHTMVSGGLGWWWWRWLTGFDGEMPMPRTSERQIVLCSVCKCNCVQGGTCSQCRCHCCCYCCLLSLAVIMGNIFASLSLSLPAIQHDGRVAAAAALLCSALGLSYVMMWYGVYERESTSSSRSPNLELLLWVDTHTHTNSRKLTHNTRIHTYSNFSV